MSDQTSLARTAREQLAAGLSALQAPGVPETLMDVAAPVAQAMGVLHRIEKGGSAHGAAPEALSHVRAALALLQATESTHPAVEAAMASVAGSLSVIHALTKGAEAPVQREAAAVPPTATAPVAAQPRPAAAAAFPATTAPVAAQRPEPIPLTRVVSEPAPQRAAEPAAARAPAAAPLTAPAAAPLTASATAELVVQASLGTHSTSNFYKGLSGNDVLDSGGLFIATYNIPDVGQKLRVDVSLPGGYEFSARGVVMWSRDAPASSQNAVLSPPGFGVRLTEISAEGRQLVHRYVRNREPLFHDDF